MKRKFKLIVPSFLTLIFCLLLIAGSTFAIFSSQDQASIEVTSGKVHVTATLTNLAAFSAEATDEAGDAGSATAFGVTSNYKYVDADKLDNNHFGFTTGGTAALENNVLTLDNIVPGDKVTLTLHIVNDSTVKIKYRVRVNVLESTNSANSLKLLEGLYVMVNGSRITNINNVNNWAITTNAGDQIDDLSIQVYLPIDAGNDYQDLSTELHFTLEAVQANAKTDDLLEEINGKLKASTQVNKTMHDAVEELSSFYNLGILSRYLWDSKSDLFFDESTVEGFNYQYFQVLPAMPTTQKYSIYAGEDWTATKAENLTVGFDAGNTTGITNVSYVRTGDNLVAREVLIRTNDLGTAVEINAPKDVVHHYGVAGSLNIIAVAGQSYHEYGRVAFLEVSSGRVALESTAIVNQVHISAKTEYDELQEQEVKTNEFNPIIISIDANVTSENRPDFSRDDVEIADGGTLVVALQNGTEEVTDDTKLDYVWLTKQGIYEQIKVSETSEDAGETWVDQLSGNATEVANTQNAAMQIANNISRDADNNNKIKVELAVQNGTETKTYKVVLDEESRDLLVVDKADTSATPEVVATITETSTIEVNNVEYSIALNTNTTDNSTEIVATNKTDSTDVQKEVAVESSGLNETEKESAMEEQFSKYVARVNDNLYFDSLSAAITAANAGDTVYLLRNYSQTSQIELSKNLTLDLNGFELENSWNGYGRLFYIGSAIKFIVNGTKAGSKITTPASNTAIYGLFDFQHDDIEMIVNGGTFTGNTNNGSIFKIRKQNWKLTLNNVACSTNKGVLSCTSGEDGHLEVNGGTFTSTGSGTSIFYLQSKHLWWDLAEFNNTTVNTLSNTGIYAAVGKVEVNNCIVGNALIATDNTPWLATALAVSNGGNMVVNGGEYSGRKAAFIFTSGGLLTINSGTFTGTDNSVRAEYNSYQSGVVGNSFVYINNGTFNGSVHAEISGASLEGRTAAAFITGGSFDSDPKSFGYNKMVNTDYYDVVEDPQTHRFSVELKDEYESPVPELKSTDSYEADKTIAISLLEDGIRFVVDSNDPIDLTVEDLDYGTMVSGDYSCMFGLTTDFKVLVTYDPLFDLYTIASNITGLPKIAYVPEKGVSFLVDQDAVACGVVWHESLRYYHTLQEAINDVKAAGEDNEFDIHLLKNVEENIVLSIANASAYQHCEYLYLDNHTLSGNIYLNGVTLSVYNGILAANVYINDVTTGPTTANCNLSLGNRYNLSQDVNATGNITINGEEGSLTISGGSTAPNVTNNDGYIVIEPPLPTKIILEDYEMNIEVSFDENGLVLKAIDKTSGEQLGNTIHLTDEDLLSNDEYETGWSLGLDFGDDVTDSPAFAFTSYWGDYYFKTDYSENYVDEPYEVAYIENIGFEICPIF